MKRILMIAVLCCGAIAAMGQIERPKLVVGVIVDQMRWDYLYYYYEDYGNDGIKRLLREGFSCENTMITHVPTVTAIGHSSVYTGSVPYFTGIAGNGFMIDGKPVSSCDDMSVDGVGTSGKAGHRSPRNMLATTIGDELKQAFDFECKVMGIAIKDRASILPAGHSADAAYWWDSEVGHFVTSSYYMDRLPGWVEKFNRRHNTEPKFDLNTSNLGVTYTFRMAEAILKNEKLGQGKYTDLLAVSVSSTDAIGHTYSTRGRENYEVYMQLDKELAHFFNELDKRVGRGNYLLFLTADHGAAHNPNFMKEHNQPAGGWDAGLARKSINKAVEDELGVSNVVKAIYDYRIYLNDSIIESNDIDKNQVKEIALDVLKQDKDLILAVDYDKVEQASIPSFLKERIINGYHRGRSGDIFVMTRAGYLPFKVKDDYKGTTHSAWNPYDSHIPLVFMGWHITPGETTIPTRMVDIAPTVCSMLHIQMPNSCIGEPIQLGSKK
ncbi:MAG: alkaline phosphatase family protein [Muribaculaceae bacterium]|nr:alkaline phosphatase family protein [Muribaculaceae bacterium]MDY6292773.1 alkaline phosphatase family protein [Bacteroidales bacterium]